MTKDQVLRLEGRALDEAIAEYLHGWQRISDDGSPKWLDIYGRVVESSRLPRYSISNYDAWINVQRLVHHGRTMTLRRDKGGTWHASFDDHIAQGETAALALYRAALLAVLASEKRAGRTTQTKRGRSNAGQVTLPVFEGEKASA